RPCYLLDEGYAQTFRELMEETDWDGYGRASGNPKCGDCMVHCGYEPAAVEATFGSLRGLLRTARLMVLGPPRARPGDETHAPLPSPVPRLQPNGLPSLPILDRVA
ncbi:MAG: DUF3463 domain-containing protein, partial [Planctomycetia bacterium]